MQTAKEIFLEMLKPDMSQPDDKRVIKIELNMRRCICACMTP